MSQLASDVGGPKGRVCNSKREMIVLFSMWLLSSLSLLPPGMKRYEGERPNYVYNLLSTVTHLFEDDVTKVLTFNT